MTSRLKQGCTSTARERYSSFVRDCHVISIRVNTSKMDRVRPWKFYPTVERQQGEASSRLKDVTHFFQNLGKGSGVDLNELLGHVSLGLA